MFPTMKYQITVKGGTKAQNERWSKEITRRVNELQSNFSALVRERKAAQNQMALNQAIADHIMGGH